jgi:ubiquinol-cytochrome c reductase cytochrome c subunit
VKRITAWRRRSWSTYAVVLVALAAIGTICAFVSPKTDSAEAQSSSTTSQQVAEGRALFDTTCSSCHSLNATGTSNGPSLIGVGAAAVDFQVSTGRMPAQTLGAEMDRKKPVFNAQQTHDIAAFIQWLGGGPTIPSSDDVNPSTGNSALGGQLFRANCAQCHNFAGSGGALTYGKYAPSLDLSTPTQMYEAMLTGPEAMPVFANATITPQMKRDIIAYVTQTRAEPNPGGNGLDRIGPVMEGLVGWLVGLGLLIVAAIWLTAKKPEKLKKQHD